MIQEKSEDSIVPEGRRKSVQTPETGGGKAVPVEQQMEQLELPFMTAENPQGTTDEPVGDRSPTGSHEGPKMKDKEGKAPSATMERVVERLYKAFVKVAQNDGAPGPDGQTIEDVKKSLSKVIRELERKLLAGTYRPGEIRRKNIPKAGGGERGLGIPNVVDRIVQEAIRQTLEPLYEPEFHGSSHGFRPGRSCQTAIREAHQYVSEGYDWVVDIDLEKFFDRVNHQRLMAVLGRKIGDERLLKAIHRMLKSEVVMPEGVVVRTEEGVPQGGPLSPLLSNIVLDEMDRELERRDLRFVRYADDCNVFVRSERAGKRVMTSLKSFIERRLRLKVNEGKSAVARPRERHFLGFRLEDETPDGEVDIRLSKRTCERIETRLREMTPRNWGRSIKACVEKLNTYLQGWLGFFSIVSEREVSKLGSLDAHLRRRLRAMTLKQWKRKETMRKRLERLGVRGKTARKVLYEGRKSIWALSISSAAHVGLSNRYFAELGLYSLKENWSRKQGSMVVPTQMALPLG